MPVVGSTAYASASQAFSLIRSMVNDADIPSVVTITPTGAVRAGNLVTITTSTAHGLQQNSVVQVGSVSDTSFNGSQVVSSVPSSTTFTYNQAGPNASSGNGVVSVLIQGDWATDAVLLPLVNKAYRKVQQKMLEAGSKTMTSESTLTMTLGQTSLTDTTSPQLPVNFLAPRVLYEKISGTPFYGPSMEPVDVLPSGPQGSVNRYFSWREDGIWFNGATNSLDMLIRYFQALPDLSDGTSSIQIRGGLDAVASYGAFLADNSRGGMNSTVFSSLFGEDMGNLLNMQAHARQYLPGRRQPYGGRRIAQSGRRF